MNTDNNNFGNVWRYHKGEVTSIDVYGDKTEIASVGEDASINIFNFDNLNYHRKIGFTFFYVPNPSRKRRWLDNQLCEIHNFKPTWFALILFF